MIPAAFEYHAPTSLAAKILSGGQVTPS